MTRPGATDVPNHEATARQGGVLVREVCHAFVLPELERRVCVRMQRSWRG